MSDEALRLALGEAWAEYDPNFDGPSVFLDVLARGGFRVVSKEHLDGMLAARDADDDARFFVAAFKLAESVSPTDD